MSASTKNAGQSLPPTIEVLVDGVPRTVDIGADGTWETTVADLSIATHTLEATSGEVESQPYSLKVESGSITEDWSDLAAPLIMRLNQSYTTPTHKLTITNLIQTNSTNVIITPNLIIGVWSIWIDLIFPSPAKSICFSINTGTDIPVPRVSFVDFYNNNTLLLRTPITQGTNNLTYSNGSPCSKVRISVGNADSHAGFFVTPITWEFV